MIIKFLIAIKVILSITPKKQSKRLNETEPIDDYKVKIIENQSEFEILIKDSVEYYKESIKKM